jgi:hypothetical protein
MTGLADEFEPIPVHMGNFIEIVGGPRNPQMRHIAPLPQPNQKPYPTVRTFVFDHNMALLK